MPELNDLQQPENDDDEQDGAKNTTATIAPVARVGEDGEGAEQQKNENDDDDEFQGNLQKLRFRPFDAASARRVISLHRMRIFFDDKQRSYRT